ncbi:competence protein ComG, partial [Streptococcus pyogenes]
MPVKTNLKAGILLYAMFMTSIFLLVLQVYLSQVT